MTIQIHISNNVIFTELQKFPNTVDKMFHPAPLASPPLT